MKEANRNRIKRSKLPTFLIACSVILFVLGGIYGTWAYMGVFSENYYARFAMNHLEVRLTENGIERDETKKLLEPLDGKIMPGKVYTEKIAGKNPLDVRELVRLSLRTYWVDKNGKKNQKLDPSLIQLTYSGKDYNDSAWQINPDETTAERRTFYYRKPLEAHKSTEPVVDTLCVSGDVVKYVTKKEDKKTVENKTIYTYEYDYDGMKICIEADVQAIQVNNANDAIRSLWGVPNVSYSGGRLVVTAN